MRGFAFLVAIGLLASCAPAPVATPSAPSVSPAAVSDAVVPPLLNLTPEQVDLTAAKAGLVPILHYEPALLTEVGLVAAVDPAVGTRLPSGSVVTVTVAGNHGPSLQDYATAHRETFIGIGADQNGVLIAGVHTSADMSSLLAKIATLVHGKAYRIQQCTRSWADLQRVQLELGRRDFSPDAASLSFATAIDPLACAVRLTADLPEAVIATLTARYQGALVIQKGSGTRGG